MKPMEEFAYFKWMTLNEIPSCKDVEPCLEYLIGKGADVDDAKCFDQICNLKQFVESYLQDKEFIKLPTHKKLCKYFGQSKNITWQYRESLFTDANQWTKERNKLSVATMNSILTF